MKFQALKNNPRLHSGVLLLLELALLLIAVVLVLSQVNWSLIAQEWRQYQRSSHLSCPPQASGTCSAQYSRGELISASCNCQSAMISKGS